MKNIEVKVLNPEAVCEARKMMAFTARLTQRGEKIKDMDDLLALYDKSHSVELINTLSALPHPTLQKFEVVNVAIVGASRRFLAQITRHQNEVKFMSASLQYSDYSDDGAFVVPYEIMEQGEIAQMRFLDNCKRSMFEYKQAIEIGLNSDTAGYLAPQALSNVLIISATPYQWKHMIGQRTCRRNTSETRYVMLRIWEKLFELDSVLFSFETTAPYCERDGICPEGRMSCGDPLDREANGVYTPAPSDLVAIDFPLLAEQ